MRSENEKYQELLEQSDEEMLMDDIDDWEDDQGEPVPCRCNYDDDARKGFVSVQLDTDGNYEERPCPDCNKNDHQNKKCCEKCNGTGMYYDDPEKAKIRTGHY